MRHGDDNIKERIPGTDQWKSLCVIVVHACIPGDSERELS